MARSLGRLMHMTRLAACEIGNALRRTFIGCVNPSLERLLRGIYGIFSRVLLRFWAKDSSAGQSVSLKLNSPSQCASRPQRAPLGAMAPHFAPLLQARRRRGQVRARISNTSPNNRGSSTGKNANFAVMQSKRCLCADIYCEETKCSLTDWIL
jgi:hypothetical protein